MTKIDDNPEQLFTLAISLADVVKHMFRKTGRTELSGDPLVQRKPVIEYMHRMRVFGMEKFETPTFISSVNYYLTEKDLYEHKTLGTVIIYVEQDYVGRLLRILQYPVIDEDDEDALKDACGTLCNVIAGQFKAEIVNLGYVDLHMSHFSSFRNSAFEGIEFNSFQKEKYEISFFIGQIKRLVVEVTMGQIPKPK